MMSRGFVDTGNAITRIEEDMIEAEMHRYESMQGRSNFMDPAAFWVV